MEMTARVVLFSSWVLQQHWPELACLIALPYVYIAYQRLHHRRQDELFRVVSENAADLIALVEVTGKRLYNSPSYEKVLGYSPKHTTVAGDHDVVLLRATFRPVLSTVLTEQRLRFGVALIRGRCETKERFIRLRLRKI